MLLILFLMVKNIKFLLKSCALPKIYEFNLLLLQLVALKQETNVPSLLTQQPIQSNSSCISTSKQVTLLNATENSVISESQTAIDLLKTDNINIPKTIASESEASNKSESTILDQVSIATPQKSTLDLIALSSNDLEETDVVDTNETSVMNIKITNVTSLPPEVFESVPDVCDDITFHTNTTDTSSLSANKTLEQLVTHVSSTKRCINEGNLRKKKKKFIHYTTYTIILYLIILHYIFQRMT